MAFLEFTGKDMTFEWKTITFAGVKSVTVDDRAGPLAEDIDVTVSGDTAYDFNTDPLGTKGSDGVTVTILMQDSGVGVADSTYHAEIMGVTGMCTFCPDDSITTMQLWTHADLRLQRRRHTIRWDAYAEVEVTLESPASAGTWSTTT